MSTIKDVAKEAGVSVATVSRVINNNGYVNEDTRKKVMDAIDQLNYKPNAVARSLFKKQSKMIGLIVPDITNPFFPQLARAVEDVTNQAGYTLVLCNSDSEILKEQEYIDVLKQKYVDGFIIVTSTLQKEHIEGIGVPIVALDRPIDDSTPTVGVDNYEGARAATRFLIDKGCKKIAHVRGPYNVLNADARCLGFVDEVQELPWFQPDLIVNGEFNLQKTTQVMRALLTIYPDIDGVFAGNDLMAIGVLKAAEELGRKVPEDLSVVGFDGIVLSEITTPELTTMSQPIYEIGTTAAQMLLGIIEGKPLPKSNYTFPVKLIERKSTRS
ncbi:LacI family DNA-binding transcriptional regulator [Schinkia sp. CFF1]